MRLSNRVLILAIARAAGWGWSWSGGSWTGRWCWSRTALVECWAWDDVLGDSAVDVEQDSRVSVLVKRCALDTSWLRGSGARHLDVDALWVVLRTVELTGRVQGDDFVAENVLAWRDVGGDLQDVGIVILDQLVCGPDTRSIAPINQTLLGDLEEVELRLVDTCAIAVAGGEVVDYGSLVGFGPWCPLELDGAAGVDGDGGAEGVGG